MVSSARRLAATGPALGFTAQGSAVLGVRTNLADVFGSTRYRLSTSVKESDGSSGYRQTARPLQSMGLPN